MTIYTSQPDETDGIDNYITSGSPTTVFNNTAFNIGLTSGSYKRGLLKFDLTKGTNPPPAGAIVVGTPSLILYCEDYNVARTIAAYECLRDWVEAAATWTRYSVGNNWEGAGASGAGDYDSTELGSVAVSAAGFITIPLAAAIVQKWINTQNYGLVLRHTAETTNQNVYTTSQGVTAARRPLLTFDYGFGQLRQQEVMIL